MVERAGILNIQSVNHALMRLDEGENDLRYSCLSQHYYFMFVNFGGGYNITAFSVVICVAKSSNRIIFFLKSIDAMTTMYA